jgi:membrane protease YdiL (CAAX protease family)
MLGAAVVLIYFSSLLYPASFKFRENLPTPNVVLGITALGAAAAAAIAIAFPRSEAGLIRVLAATALVYLSFRLAIPWILFLSKLPLTTAQKYWVYRGPGNAVVGLLPSATAVLLAGRFLFGLSLREQWNGRLAPAWRDVWYGGSVGVALSAIVLIGAAVAGQRVAWEPNWSQNGVNVFSNLYEEILARSLLLQVARREAGNWFAMIWTGLVFGSMHGWTWMALGFALCTWVIAWVVLRAGSLWAGWVFHQVIDVLVDSSLH